jgi:MbtH protein
VWEDEENDDLVYKVVVNHEEQYSIWPAHWANPAGWNDVGKSGPRAECLAYIEETWTDMRPLSVRRQLEQAASAAPAPSGKAPGTGS